MAQSKVEGQRIKESPGRDSLRRWFEQTCSSKLGFAKRVKVSPQAVTAWLDGKSRPDDHKRALVRLVTGIAESDWNLPEEVERQRRELAEVQANEGEPSKGAA